MRCTVCVLVLLATTFVREPLANQQSGQGVTISVCHTGFIHMPVRRGEFAVLHHTGSTLDRVLWGDDASFRFVEDRLRDFVKIEVAPDAEVGRIRAGVFVTTTNIVVAIFEVAADSEPAISNVAVINEPRAACMARAASGLQSRWGQRRLLSLQAHHETLVSKGEKCAADLGTRDERVRELEAEQAVREVRLAALEAKLAAREDAVRSLEGRLAMARTQGAEEVIIEEMLGQPVKQPLRVHEDGGVGVSFTRWQAFGRYDVAIFEIENASAQPYRIANVHAYSADRTRDHAGRVRVGDDAAPEGLLGVVPAGTRVQAGVRVHDKHLAGGHIALMLSEVGGRRPAMSQNFSVSDFIEPWEDTIGKKTVGVEASVGGAWVPSGGVRLATGADMDRLSPALSKTLGLWFLYGMTERWNFELLAALAATDAARFEDVTLADGRSGDYLRSATTGSVRGGFRLRFDAGWYRPYVHGGVGVQVARYDASLDMNGAVVDAPGDGFDMGGLGYFGGGVDIPLGPLVLEMGARYGFAIAAMGRLLEVSVGLGYSWK